MSVGAAVIACIAGCLICVVSGYLLGCRDTDRYWTKSLDDWGIGRRHR